MALYGWCWLCQRKFESADEQYAVVSKCCPPDRFDGDEPHAICRPCHDAIDAPDVAPVLHVLAALLARKEEP